LNIIDTCCSKSVLFADPMGGLDDDDDEGNNNTRRRPQDQNGNKTKDESDDTATKSPSPTPLLRSDFSLIESLTSGQQNFVLSDPRLPDNPIVYASSGFYELTGYTREQVLGRNCRFLQGSGTSRKAVDILRTAVANGTDATVCLLNYKADGTPFWNQLFVAALRDGDNCIVNYVSSLSSWIEYLMLESFDLCVACVFFLSRPHLNHLLFLTHSHRLVCKH
jgi:PAS domain S-box-containing protein